MTQQELSNYLLSFQGAWIDFPFGDETAVYKVGKKSGGEEEKMFALIENGSKPLRISLKCDPQLAEILRERYETVLPGRNLNKKYWNTILCTGQMPDEEIKDLARLSYRLAAE